MNAFWPLFVGGVAPAILWGITAIFQKQSATAGAGSSAYLITFGLTLVLTGTIAAFLWRPAPWTVEGIGSAALAGICFALGTGLISYALFSYGVPVSKLAPIWSCNVLVTLAVGAIFLGEASQVDLLKLSLGTLLIIGGAILVSNA